MHKWGVHNRYAGAAWRTIQVAMDEWDEELADIAEEPESGTDAALTLDLLPTRLSIGPSRVLLNWRLNLTNSGATHIVALRVWSDLVSAHSSVPSEEQLGGPDIKDARLQQIAWLKPGEQHSVIGEWQMPRDAVRPVDNSTDQLILPLARLRLVGAGIAPFRQAFVIGQPPAPGEERLRALHLDGNMQIHSRLSARAVM